MTHIHHRLTHHWQKFIALEAAGGVVMLVAAGLALILANIPDAAPFYDQLSLTLRPATNLGLMTLFFMMIGLELRQEAARQKPGLATTLLPIMAAVGGMAVPALIYVAAMGQLGPELLQGWAIPTATDIAFSVCVLMAVSRAMPNAARLLLLKIAIFDDIGGVILIALFYGSGHWWHPAIFGTVIGLLWPVQLGVRPGASWPQALNGEHVMRGIAPFVTFLVVPLFAFVNAGVTIGGLAVASPLIWVLALALVLGKPLGIVGMVRFLGWLRPGIVAPSITPRILWGVGCIAGIGFTVSYFIADLSFSGELLATAKAGVLLGSVASAILGYLVLRRG
ncbi:MAG: Na+/H+ antiporter NhaA [Candidatus Symbiobacter sp.]|nr:Na+/H+ antiporter NhaA [Candidatus Symbiobacter sp.]